MSLLLPLLLGALGLGSARGAEFSLLGLATDLDGADACAYDVVEVAWTAPADSVPSEEAWVGLFHASAEDHYPISTYQLRGSETAGSAPSEFLQSTANVTVLACDMGGVHCAPEVTAVVLEGAETWAFGARLVVSFAQDTTQPDVSDAAALARLLEFEPSLGTGYMGAWRDARTLAITCENPTGHGLGGEEGAGGAVPRAVLRRRLARLSPDADGVMQLEEEEPVRGRLRVRIGAEGEYDFRFFSPPRTVASLSSAPFRVRSCAEVAVVHSSETRAPPSIPAASFRVKGVMSMNGERGFVLPRESLPSQDSGSWALSFWLYLAEDSIGQYRTLFYKGEGQARTPSSWLLSHDRRFTLKASTAANADLGLDSTREVPLQRWVHMAYTFENHTHANAAELEPGAVHYTMRVYLDGQLEKDLLYHEAVLANGGDLHVGKDGTFPGPRALFSDFRVFPKPLTADEVRFVFEQRSHYYQAGKSAELTSPQLHAVELLRNAPSSLLPGVAQRGATLPEGSARALELVEQADRLEEQCAPVSEVAPLLEDAAQRGHADAAFRAAMMLLRGETPAEEAGCSAADPDGGASNEVAQRMAPGAGQRAAWVRSTARARELMELATAAGHGEATSMLAYMHSAGVGDAEAASRQEDAVGLYHAAAMGDVNEAQLALANRYFLGEGVEQDDETAAFYYLQVADRAAVEYHKTGAQPLNEMNLLSQATEATVEEAQRGDEDELLQYELMQADAGNVASMNAVANLLYWGGRGFQRDQARALEYWERAAATGNPSAQVAAAGMYLKGEGCEKNNETALAYYEAAAAQGSVAALNGLGYVYFMGTAGEVNQTKAFEYFERAAHSPEANGDAVFNTGHCYQHGAGVERDLTKAAEYFRDGAVRFGHFDSVHQLGQMYLTGNGVERSAVEALRYLRPAAMAGPWGGVVRDGFDRYLARDMDGALLLYMQASELGYDTAHQNAAFLLGRGLASGGGGSAGSREATDRQALRWMHLAAESGSKEAMLSIGDYYHGGRGGVAADQEKALYWYSKASAGGSLQAGYNLGYMHEYGLGVERDLWKSERYYQRVLEQSTEPETHVVVTMTLWRVAARRWLLLRAPEPVVRLLGLRAPASADEARATELPSLWTPASASAEAGASGYGADPGNANAELWFDVLLFVLVVVVVMVVVFTKLRAPWRER